MKLLIKSWLTILLVILISLISIAAPTNWFEIVLMVVLFIIVLVVLWEG